MSVNLATKFSSRVAENYAREGFTATAVSHAHDEDFLGAATVKVYTNISPALNDYDTTASANRYGTPADLMDTVQELSMTQKKSFTYILDRVHSSSTPEAVKQANATLHSTVREVIIPHVDRYNLKKMAVEAGGVCVESEALTSSNTARAILKGTEYLDDANAPRTNRTLFIKPAVYANLKCDTDFIKSCDLGQSMLVSGEVGMFDGMRVIVVPTNYMPRDVNFIIAHRDACVAPVKLEEYNIHEKPQGISGVLVEGLIYHDLFVLGAKRRGVYVSVENGSNIATDAIVVTKSGENVTLESDDAIYYTTDGTDPMTSNTAAQYRGESLQAGSVLAYAKRLEATYHSGIAVA